MAAPGKGKAQPGARGKEELKEKLALLRREYRKTFSRLQRAERAERVKSYVQKTVAEQNSLLLQEEGPAGTAFHFTDPTGRPAPEASAGIPVGSCPETGAAKTPSVTFSLEPEVFGREGPLPEHSGSERTDEEHERIVVGTAQLVPGGTLSRLSRSRRGRPSVASEERRDVPRDGDPPGHEGASREGPQSPVFTGHGSSLKLEPSLPETPSVTTAERGGNPAPPLTPPLEHVRGPLGENVPPGVLGPPPGCLLDEGASGPPEGSAVEGAVLLPDAQNVSTEEERGREDEEDLGGTAPQASGSGTPQERSPLGKPRSSGHCSRDSPTIEPGRAGAGCEAGAVSPLQEKGASPAAPTDSLRDSCTVIEGLLFPVEYYVRTTRRMSRCQQEPNLDAVIQSQLGPRRRRSQRVSPKERVASSAPPPGGLPASPPAASQESGSGSPPAPEEQGEGVPPSEGPTQRSRRGRRKGRGRPGRRPPSRGAREPLASAGSEGNGGLTASGECRSEPPREPAGNQSHAWVEAAQRGTVSLRPSESPSAPPERPAGRAPPPGGRGSRSRVAAPDPSPLVSLGIPGNLQWLSSDFQLPADEFAHLQSEKVRASAPKAPETAEAAGESVGHLRGADGGDSGLQAAGERPGGLLLSPEGQPAEPPALHTSSLLLSPANTLLEEGSPPPESLLPTLLFPMVGATPATQDFCNAPWHVPAGSPQEPRARAAGQPVCGTEEERCHTGASCPEDGGGARPQHGEAAAVSLEAGRELAAEPRELGGASADQHDAAADGLVQAPRGRQGEGTLQMTSKLKNPAGSCSVDVSAVWWEVADFGELRIVIACKTSVALWRRLDSGCWETVHTWSFAEVPVFQLVPLPGAHSLVCVALGAPEIAELRLLFHSLKEGCLKQSRVKAGNIKAVLGLSGRRLASSCDGAVEVLSFHAEGRCRRQTLFCPKETTLAFAAVDGLAEALVGLTASNSVLVWNLSTGQLLCRMPLSYACPAPVCHQAYSDSGLLFVVLSHPRAKEDEVHGSPAFQVVALNPKTGRSASVMTVSLPPGLQGRYLEGDVRDASAAAVLTSGAIAMWDLLRGECTALLPPSAEGSWSLVRWSVTDRWLLAGQTDGSLCIYSYDPVVFRPRDG